MAAIVPSAQSDTATVQDSQVEKIPPNKLGSLGGFGVFSCISTVIYSAGLDPELINTQVFTAAFGCLITATVFCLGYGTFSRWGQAKEISMPNLDSTAAEIFGDFSSAITSIDSNRKN
ncbi:MAG: hypothetical protein AB8B55_00175 [Mariniblastus sp.]